MRTFQHIYARDLEHATELLSANPGCSTVVSGGSDLLAMMKERLVTPDIVVNLQRVPGLNMIRENEDGGLTIGAMSTLRNVELHRTVRACFATLAQAAASVASPAIRQVATVGGNLAQKSRCWYYRGPFNCWLKGGSDCLAIAGENTYHAIFGEGPCFMVQPSDLATALYVLGAEITTLGPKGKTALPAHQFFINPTSERRQEHVLNADEIVVGVTAPALPATARTGFIKAMQRNAWDAAIVSIAYCLIEEDGMCAKASIALGGVATTPIRARLAEERLIGQRLSRAVFAESAALAVEDARPLSQNAYKIPLLKGYFESIFDRLQADFVPGSK